MFRRDPDARWQYRDVGSIKQRRLWRFYSGKHYAQEQMDQEQFAILSALQLRAPIVVMTGTANRRWWMFQNEFYYEDENYSDREMKALILDSVRHKQRMVQRAMARISLEEEASGTRQPIPEQVKMEVWRRDGGRCVNCGSRENLEFDHIIPLSQGGSNTARNLQILCEKCNRSKGANLV
jgi:5-methylcytosine-specific restriction endonuclease McrA